MPIKTRQLDSGKIVYDIRVQVGGIRKCRTIRSSFTAAKRVESRMLHELINGKYEIFKNLKNPFFRQYADAYLKAVRWQKSHRRTVTLIKNLKSFFRNKRLSEITTQDFLDYRSLRLKTVSPATLNREHTCLKTMLKIAVISEEYQIIKNPLMGVKKLHEKPAENRILTVDEYHKLQSAAPEYFRRILFIACNTGLRKMEILNLTFGQIRAWHTGAEIELLETKSGNKEYVPLSAEVIELIRNIAHEKNINLNNMSNDDRKTCVFTGLRGQKIDSIRKPLKYTFKIAKVDEKPFHTFRHFWTKMMFEAGVDPATIQAVGRWRDFGTMLKYCFTTRSQEHDAVNKLSARLGKKSAKSFNLRQYSG